MSQDVLELAEFYAGPRGAPAIFALNRQISALWPDLAGQRVLGLGFTLPVLEHLREQGDPFSLLALMPERQGVMGWVDARPEEQTCGRTGNAAALVQPGALPVRDAVIDKVLIMHGLEHAAFHSGYLREVWRVLAPGGTLIAVVPNRLSPWARAENTPYGHGTPYTRVQLASRLRTAMFTPLDWRMALAAPPIWGLAYSKQGRMLERIGTRAWPRFAGLHVVLAQKQMAAMSSGGHGARLPRLMPARAGVPVPAGGAAANLPKQI